MSTHNLSQVQDIRKRFKALSTPEQESFLRAIYRERNAPSDSLLRLCEVQWPLVLSHALLGGGGSSQQISQGSVAARCTTSCLQQGTLTG